MLNESIIEGASAACGVIATIADENLTVAHGDLLPSELATLMANTRHERLAVFCASCSMSLFKAIQPKNITLIQIVTTY